jgi:carboxylesterase type B
MAKSRGRPRTPAIPGRTYGLGITVEGDLKALLERAADASGLTQSQEAARRLKASFDRDQRAGGQREAALLEAMGAAALAKVGADWIDDFERFSVVAELWQDMLTEAVPDRPVVIPAEVEAAIAQRANARRQFQRILERVLKLLERERAKLSSDAIADHVEGSDNATDRDEE